MKVAMILAAGRGERMKPITDLRPKALCKVHNIPLIEYHIKHLAAAGFERLIINHAHLGGQIRQYLGSGSRFGLDIIYAPEPPGGLETGGGIVNALPLLGMEPFLTINADIFTNINFALLTLPDTSLVHMVFVNKPTYLIQGDFGLSNKGVVDNISRHYTFAGIACYRPEIFQGYQPGRYSVTPTLRQLATNKLATGEIFDGMWFDIGIPARLEWVNKNSF